VEPLPAGWRLVPDERLRRLEGGRVLLGGSPPRLVRLPPAAARAVERWCAGEALPPAIGSRRLARRLVEAGLLHPLPEPRERRADVAVVVPARDRAEPLARCLRALGAGGDVDVTVVDDGSDDAGAVAAAAVSAGARLLRREHGGPAAARNTGLAATSAELVAFVDSDCVPPRGWLERLLPYFDDPLVAAVAPRIVGLDGAPTWVAAYERARSPLDMGPRPAAVRPGSRVPYVPTAALVVRRAALPAPAFDERLAVGEDVDLGWRLAAAGWVVRYVPEVEVAHEHRLGLGELLRRRIAYNSAAGPLGSRHPAAIPAASVSPWLAAAWGLAALGRPALGAAAVGVPVLRLRRALAPLVTRPTPLALRLCADGALGTGRQLATAVGRPWSPAALALALARHRLRAPLAAAVLAPAVAEWAVRRPQLSLARYAGARVLDELACGLGVWIGCARARTVAPLLPRISRRRR